MSSSPPKANSIDSPLRRALEQPPLKRFRIGKTQDAGTLTDPETLGPCEPGTAINLDGIVWNETKGGLLSLNITWRGKSFMGTLLDCSTSDHGSEWAAPWTNDTEAPDLKPKSFWSKKKNKKKKKKKRKINSEDPGSANVSSESLEGVRSDRSEDSSLTSLKPTQLIECRRESCRKKFTSESALKYHVTFAHEKIAIKERNVNPDKTGQAGAVEPDKSDSTDEAGGTTESSEPSLNLVERRTASLPGPKCEQDKVKAKTFPSTQHIRPILPVQTPQIAGSSLKPIQPKPAILPPPTKNLNLENLKKSSSRSPSQKSDQSDERGEEPAAMDLSTTKSSTVAFPGEKNEMKNKAGVTGGAPSLPKSLCKAKAPLISVKSEFNTGNRQVSVQDRAGDELEVLKHISRGGQGGPGAVLGAEQFLPPSLPPSLLGLASNPLMLPGMMNLPPAPATPSPLSPFGASLESLARAAEERARTFGANFSPGAGLGRGNGPGAGQPPVSSEAGGDSTPLLRHEHMHTHLHYITSPTHHQ